MRNQFSSFQESLEYELDYRNQFNLKKIVKINLSVNEYVTGGHFNNFLLQDWRWRCLYD